MCAFFRSLLLHYISTYIKGEIQLFNSLCLFLDFLIGQLLCAWEDHFRSDSFYWSYLITLSVYEKPSNFPIYSEVKLFFQQKICHNKTTYYRVIIDLAIRIVDNKAWLWWAHFSNTVARKRFSFPRVLLLFSSKWETSSGCSIWLCVSHNCIRL